MRAHLPTAFALALCLTASSALAEVQGPLPPGHPAGVKKAQDGDNTLILVLGIGVVAAGIAIAASGGSDNNGNPNPGGGNNVVTTTGTV